MSSINVKGKPAITIEAERLIMGDKPGGGGASFYDCEGDRIWVPQSVCEYDKNNNELKVQEWFYDKLIDEGYLEC